jgi:hypothetical protein
MFIGRILAGCAFLVALGGYIFSLSGQYYPLPLTNFGMEPQLDTPASTIIPTVNFPVGGALQIFI